MIDLENFRKNPEIYKKEISKRNMKINVEDDIVLDQKRRNLIFKVDEIRAKKNDASKLIPGLSGDKKQKVIEDMKSLNESLNTVEKKLSETDKLFFERFSLYPNISHPSVPAGKDENDNVVAYMIGSKPDFGFKPRNHQELGLILDIIDENRAAKISGSRFICPVFIYDIKN